MNIGQVIWSRKASSKSNNIRNFMLFLYEFLGVRFSIIAFLALISVATAQLPYFEKVLTISVSLLMYYLLRDAFNIYWTGINLQYSITELGIKFDWGVFRNKDLFIEFDKVSKVQAVIDDDKQRRALIFENDSKLKNGDYGFSKEIYFSQLSFENLVNIEQVIDVFETASDMKVEVVKNSQTQSWSKRLPSSTLYYKFIQLLALGFIFIATHTSLKLIDNNILLGTLTTERVIKESVTLKHFDHKYYTIETSGGHKFEIDDAPLLEDNKITFTLSPMYSDVTAVNNLKRKKDKVSNGYIGYNRPFKILLVIVLIISTFYIFYKRGSIIFEELSVIVMAPVLALILAFLLFH